MPLGAASKGRLNRGLALAAGVRRYGYTGGVQTFTVPKGVTELVVELYGASGGKASSGAAPGKGAVIRGKVPVVAGEVLNVYVGGKGPDGLSGGGTVAGGYNGGGASGGYSGGGGGSSDIRRGTALADRLITAAAGAGSGYNTSDRWGGYGGTTQGQNGSGYSPGQGATQTAGGAGGTSAGAGGLGFGGGATTYGGGGGSGLYGGGGGNQAGGGGGSSGIVSGGTITSWSGNVITGNGEVVIAWAATNLQRFDPTGADQSFTVPAGVKELGVELWGGGGGLATTGDAADTGGQGHIIRGTLKVTPGEVLTIRAGQKGGDATGAQARTNGGHPGGGQGGYGPSGRQSGAGGGYTAILRGTTPVVIAGAGGGQSYNHGGDGDHPSGQNGESYGGQSNDGGYGGTQTAGGGGGTQGTGSTSGGSLYGGAGSTGSQYWGGGGGGAGLYGGGGGGGNTATNYGTSGGGGSSLIPTTGGELAEVANPYTPVPGVLFIAWKA